MSTITTKDDDVLTIHADTTSQDLPAFNPRLAKEIHPLVVVKAARWAAEAKE